MITLVQNNICIEEHEICNILLYNVPTVLKMFSYSLHNVQNEQKSHLMRGNHRCPCQMSYAYAMSTFESSADTFFRRTPCHIAKENLQDTIPHSEGSKTDWSWCPCNLAMPGLNNVEQGSTPLAVGAMVETWRRFILVLLL